MAGQLVHVAEYDPAWPDRFAGQQDRAATILAQWLAAATEHIGSTAVPGLPAKPVIDMLAPVRSLALAQDAVAPLQAGGWVFWRQPERLHHAKSEFVAGVLRTAGIDPPARDRLPD